MLKVEKLNDDDQAFVAGLSKSLKEKSSRSSPVQLARLAGIAFQITFAGSRRGDKLVNAMARGLTVREKMAAEEGGSMSADEAARQLGVSKQSVLNMYHAGEVLAWRTEKQGAFRFPFWQFDGDRRLVGLKDVLARMNARLVLDDWGKIGFFLQTHEILDNRRPLDLLRENKVEPVLKAADAYVE
jgi:excisionase family DNA binding protein